VQPLIAIAAVTAKMKDLLIRALPRLASGPTIVCQLS
jgi:hypothetical protein